MSVTALLQQYQSTFSKRVNAMIELYAKYGEMSEEEIRSIVSQVI